MGVIEDVRRMFQDLIAPELKSLAVEVKSEGRESRTRDEALTHEIQAFAREAKVREELMLTKFEALSAKMDAQYASIIYNLNLDKRVDALERDKQTASALSRPT